MRKKRRAARNGSSFDLHAMTFGEAYRDASYAIMLQFVERMLSDPKRRKVIEDLTIKLLKSMVEELEGRSASPSG